MENLKGSEYTSGKGDFTDQTLVTYITDPTQCLAL